MSRQIKKYGRIYGFNKDREGLITRYLNEPENWSGHLQRSKQFILNSAENYQTDCCMILGSGWLLDVPIKELSYKFGTVILVDISHPKQILHKYGNIKNIRFVSDDISGVLDIMRRESFYSNKNFSEELKNAFSFKLFEEYSPGLTVSLNLLSQIAWFPVKFAENRMDINKQTAEDLTKYIQQLHLDHLPKGKSILITDHYQYVSDFKDKLLEERSRLAVDLPEPNEEWIWDFDLSGNYMFRKKVRLKVAALQV